MTKKLKKKIIRVGIGALLFIAAVIVSKVANVYVGLAIFIAAYLVLAIDVLKNAAINISHGHIFDENFLMMVATFGAFFCKEYGEAVAVMLFYQVGECFQTYAVNKSRKSIKSLMSIRPDFARIEVDGEEKEVDPSEVNIGDIIIIKPGERVPLDGNIIEGRSAMDTAAITGESLPKEVGPGELVVSGWVNKSGVIKVSVTSNFSQSTVSKILELVEKASEKKAKAEQFITVFSRYYTPSVVGAAALLFIAGALITGDTLTWMYRAMTFLLISCPCALVISVPLSFFGGIGGAGKVGILIKGGNYMDTLSKIDTLVLDKTGTVTKGNFALKHIEPSKYFEDAHKGKAKETLLKITAIAESYSTHPIAASIVEAYSEKIDKKDVGEITEIAGKGICAEIGKDKVYVGNRKLMADVIVPQDEKETDTCLCGIDEGTIVYIAVNDRLAGHMHIVDEVKENASVSLAECKKAGIRKIVMLTGDNERTANAVCKAVGIDEYRANLTPMDKVKALEEIMGESGVNAVAFAGDGINDAPVLTRADIGIAMGAMGSDAAIEAADVVIMTDDLSKISKAKKIAAKTIRIVKENIVFALAIKLLVLVLAAFGIAHMGAAIFADVGVAFLAIMNALRALK